MDTNNVVVSGRVGKAPTFQYSFRGQAMLTFELAVHRRGGRGGVLTTWLPTLVWGKLAEALVGRVSAGQKVLVVGSLEAPPKVLGELPEGRRPLELIVQKLLLLGTEMGQGTTEKGETHQRKGPSDEGALGAEDDA